MLQIVETKSIAASCQVCRTIILDRLNIASNLGSGKYAYHYHIDCFKNEYGATIAKIMESQGELNPILVARAAKPKPAWTIKRSKDTMTIRGPDVSSSAYMESHSDTPKLDSELQTSAALLGRRYHAEILDQERLDSVNPHFTVNMLDFKKVTHIGFSNGYKKPDEALSPKAFYLIEGILKR